MQSITPKGLADNFGSLRFFRFAPLVDLVSVDRPRSFEVHGPVNFQSGKDWLNGYASQDSIGLSIEGMEAAGGPFCRFSMSFFVPQLSIENSRNFDEMVQHRFILDILDMNLKRRIVGDHRDGVAFKYSETSASQFAGRNGYNCTFYSDAVSVFYFLDGTFTPPVLGS